MWEAKRMTSVRNWVIVAITMVVCFLAFTGALWEILQFLFVAGLVVGAIIVVLAVLGNLFGWWPTEQQGVEPTPVSASRPERAPSQPTHSERIREPPSVIALPAPRQEWQPEPIPTVVLSPKPEPVVPERVHGNTCPWCQSMLAPRASGLYCRSGHGPFERIDSVVLRSEASQGRRVVVESRSEESLWGTTAFSCPRCGHDRAEAVQRWLKGVRHHPVWLLTCRKCGHTLHQDSK
jgi:DNA-directed RNA polymerase subunit M/transcription elongation factor TFIIS